MRTILHAGCGGTPLPPIFEGATEVRLDIDPDVKPDVIAPITDVGDIGPFDIVYSSHVIEHLYPQDVDIALQEFRRVLNDGGVCIAVVPDLEGIQATDEILYHSDAGPVTGMDMLFGMERLVRDNVYMSHHTGFTEKLIRPVFERNGFKNVMTWRLGGFTLMCSGTK